MINKNFITKSMISFGAVFLITLSALFDIASLVLIKMFLIHSYNLADLTKFKNLLLLLSNKSFLLGIFLFIISPIFFCSYYTNRSYKSLSSKYITEDSF